MNNIRIACVLEAAELLDEQMSKLRKYCVRAIIQNRNKNKFKIVFKNIRMYDEKFLDCYRMSLK